MNTEQTSKNIFAYIKTHYGETILAKIQKLDKTKNARWWEKYLSKRSPLKHTCSWRVNLLYYEYWTDKQKYFYVVTFTEEIPNGKLHIFGLRDRLQILSLILTISWRRSLSNRNQSIHLHSKSLDWLLCNRDLRH